MQRRLRRTNLDRNLGAEYPSAASTPISTYGQYIDPHTICTTSWILTYSTNAYIRHILPVCTHLLTNQVSRIPSQSSLFPVVKTLERLNNIGPQVYAVIGYDQTSVWE